MATLDDLRALLAYIPAGERSPVLEDDALDDTCVRTPLGTWRFEGTAPGVGYDTPEWRAWQAAVHAEAELAAAGPAAVAALIVAVDRLRVGVMVAAERLGCTPEELLPSPAALPYNAEEHPVIALDGQAGS